MHVGKETPKREWVKPSFERQDLKDALAGGIIPSGDGVGYS
jgi:hypothetical protein